MANTRKMDAAFGLLASIATVLSFILSIYSMFLPAQLNDVTGRLVGPLEASGRIRAEFVASQKWVFIAAWVVISLLVGLGMAGVYRWITAMNARAIAADRETRLWLNSIFLLFALTCIFIGIGLPEAIFQPTNEVELGRQFAIGAWALRSKLGGFVLGLFILGTSLAAAFLIFSAGVTLPRTLVAKRYQRIMQND